MKHFIFVVAMLFSSIALPSQSAHEFKGLTPGMSYESALANPKLHCHEETRQLDKLLADKSCTLKLDQSETIAGAPIKSMWLRFYDDRLSRINIDVNTVHFLQIKEALTEKYGKGLIENSIIQNRSGASFDNETVTWPGDNDVMTLTKRSGRVDNAELEIRSKDSLEEFKKRMKKDAGDL